MEEADLSGKKSVEGRRRFCCRKKKGGIEINLPKIEAINKAEIGQRVGARESEKIQ